jgi:DNA replication protein DnaD
MSSDEVSNIIKNWYSMNIKTVDNNNLYFQQKPICKQTREEVPSKHVQAPNVQLKHKGPTS